MAFSKVVWTITGYTGCEEPGEVPVDDCARRHLRDVASALRRHRRQRADVDADSGDAPEAAARVRRDHCRSVLQIPQIHNEVTFKLKEMANNTDQC